MPIFREFQADESYQYENYFSKRYHLHDRGFESDHDISQYFSWPSSSQGKKLDKQSNQRESKLLHSANEGQGFIRKSRWDDDHLALFLIFFLRLDLPDKNEETILPRKRKSFKSFDLRLAEILLAELDPEMLEDHWLKKRMLKKYSVKIKTKFSSTLKRILKREKKKISAPNYSILIYKQAMQLISKSATKSLERLKWSLEKWQNFHLTQNSLLRNQLWAQIGCSQSLRKDKGQ